jgi:hypothetical protein
MRLPLLGGKDWSCRALKPELLETAGLALAERNLRDMARINQWFGPHRALLRVIKNLVSPQEQFSLLDVGAGSGDMGNCIFKHFRQVIRPVAELRRVARRALIVQDLERHPVAYSFLPITKRLSRWSPLTVHDGPVSVATAFRPAELATLVGAAGADSTIVQKTQTVVPHLRRCLGPLSGKNGTKPGPRRGRFSR